MGKLGVILIIAGLIVASVAGIWVFIDLSPTPELPNGQPSLPLSQRLLISGGTFVAVGAIPIIGGLTILAVDFLTKNKPWYLSPFAGNNISIT